MSKKYVTMIWLFALSTLLMSGCGNGANETATNENNVQALANEIEDESGLMISINDTIHSSLPEFLFKIYGYNNENTYAANKIVVSSSKSEDKKIQEINFDDTASPDKDSLGFVVEDMDFDGYKDIRIQQSTPASANIPYYYWLWDKETSKFVANPKLEEITSPEFDSKNKVITSFVKENAVTHYEDVYKYVDGIPILVKQTEEIIDEAKGVIHYTMMEFSNNEMKITKKYDEPLKD